MEYVIYDGECGICEAFRKFISARIRSGRHITFIPFQLVNWNRFPPEVSEEKARDAVCFIDRQQEIFWGTEAIARILHACRFPYSLAGKFISLPPVLWFSRPFYRWIATNRARISRRLGFRSCRL